MWRPAGIGLVLLLLCGCFKTKDELTINSDGSGRVRIETRSSVPPEYAEGMGMGRMGSRVMYPPLGEDEARKYFPEKDFKVTVKQDKAGDETVAVIEAEFKDINALLASPYGRAHQLLVKIEGGALVVKAVSGAQAAALYAEMQDNPRMGMGMSGFPDLQKKKGDMRIEWRVTLPGAISGGNGTREGKTAGWAVERAKSKDAADFARQLGAVFEARCPAEGLKMTPVTPARLGLLPFAELSEDSGKAAGATVDTNKIAAATKFIPYGLRVTRSLDLSGEGGMNESGAQLIGAVVVPREFAPQKWGEAKLDEVVDAKGNSLLPGDSAEDRMLAMRSRHVSFGSDDEAEGNAEGKTPEPKHIVNFSFHPPDWKVNEIARIKGSVSLQYFGSPQVVKVTNAIPASWITDPSKGMDGSSFDSSEKQVSSPKLAELGLTMSLRMATVQSGMTTLMFQTEGERVALGEVQVFDAEGKAWPTVWQQQVGGSDSCYLMVPGTPPPPLSLALAVSGGGQDIEVPVLLEHVAVTTK